MRPEVVLSARWSHRRILMTPIDSAASVLYRWSVDVFRLACTVKKLFDIFGMISNLAVNLPLKQTFVSLTPAMTPSLSFYYCTLCVLPRRAIWAIKRRDMFILCRDTPVNVKAGNPHSGPQNEGFFRDNSQGMRRIDETPKRHILGRNSVDWYITCGRRAFGVGCAFAQQVTR
jgi:hypothetical protein